MDRGTLQPAEGAFAGDVRRGLTGSPKSLPPRWFYDARGSELFEEITRTPEYYPTGQEREILLSHGAEIAAAAGDSVVLVELGSGSSKKTRFLIEALLRRQGVLEYVPIDISPDALAGARKELVRDYPGLTVTPIAATYDQGLRRVHRRDVAGKLVLFLGSSIGNFDLADAAAFLHRIGEAMIPGDRLLLGVDRCQDPQRLAAAYDDAAGVTAAFNRNLLERINRELGGSFDPEAFNHVAFFNEQEHRVEMHLEARGPMTVPIRRLGIEVRIDEGERIHTENSYKYTQPMLERLLAEGEMRRLAGWSDSQKVFDLHLLAP